MDALKEVVEKVKADSMKDMSLLAEIIRDYNPKLELRWIPRKARETDEEKRQPYVIVNHLSNGGEQLVMYLTEAEAANPPGVLSRLFNSDNSKHGKNGVMKRIENSERAHQIWEARQAEERLAERLDFWKSIWNSKKHTFKHEGKKYDTQHGRFF